MTIGRDAPGKGNVGIFLETLKQGQAQQQQTPIPSGAPSGTPGTPTLQGILAHLKSKGAQSIPDLAAGIGSAILPTAEVLQKMATSGLVAIDGDPGQEMVRLTDAGAGVSDLA